MREFRGDALGLPKKRRPGSRKELHPHTCAEGLAPWIQARRESVCSRRAPASSGLVSPPLPPELLETVEDLVFSEPCRGNELLHLLAGNSQGLEFCLARLGPGRNEDTDGRAVPSNGDGILRLQEVGQVLPKLAN